MKDRLKFISLEFTPISFDDALEKVKDLAFARASAYVCFANAHMLAEAHKDDSFAAQVNNASLVLTDGMSLVFAWRLLLRQKQDRIAGMDFMPELLRLFNETAEYRYKVFLFGSSPKVLGHLQSVIRQKFANVAIAGAISPPYRPLGEQEQDAYIRAINESGANLVFVSLGCPKQERWMAANYKRISAPLLGVGGAFSTMTGAQKRAPVFIQRAGLEWFYRFMQEPRRLFKRYLITNSLFLALVIREMFKGNLYGRRQNSI